MLVGAQKLINPLPGTLSRAIQIIPLRGKQINSNFNGSARSKGEPALSQRWITFLPLSAVLLFGLQLYPVPGWNYSILFLSFLKSIL